MVGELVFIMLCEFSYIFIFQHEKQQLEWEENLCLEKRVRGL